MAASLLVRVHRNVPFSAVLERASAVVSQVLNFVAVPGLVYRLPPARRGLSLEGHQIIDVNFPGAYIQFQEIDASLVNFHSFSSPVPNESARLLLACEASGRRPASEVLVVALAGAAAELVNGSIDDGGHHWLDKDEYGPQELIQSLRLSDKPRDFDAAVELVYRRQAVHLRHPVRRP